MLEYENGQVAIHPKFNKLITALRTAVENGESMLYKESSSTVLNIAKKHADVLTEKTGVEASMTDSDIKEYMAMVLNEIHKS